MTIPKLDRWIRKQVMTLVVAPILEQLQLNHREVIAKLMSQEQDLQDALAVLTVVSDGITEIISRLNALPADNPNTADEVAAVKAKAAEMADKINAVLNPPSTV